MQDQIKKLLGPKDEEDRMSKDIAGQLSAQLGRDVQVGKSKVILHPEEINKEKDNEGSSLYIEYD